MFNALRIASLFIVLTTMGILINLEQVDSLQSVSSDEVQFVNWINGERIWNGLEPLVIDGQLSSQAQDHVNRMTQTGVFEHSPMSEMSWFVDPQYNGWKNIAENIGYTTGDNLFDLHLAFVKSPGHLSNMLDPRHKGIGCAIREDSDGTTWVSIEFAGF